MIMLTAIDDSDLDVAAHLAAVAAPDAGATAVFVGTVRDNDPDADGTVVELEYSAHPDADRFLREIAEGIDRPDVRIAVSHRVGLLGVGGLAIVSAVSSIHRAEAFEVNRELVERVKAELPMWKKQIESDGTHAWVGLGKVVT
ncbi:molybdenum cofactor biosynthesis protein MoaE [Gordonia sp. (in: high G+C Gram-positive bacteria)]|uniref:molybdenum cofactor biosynthesis protein MoaE n=1 Tax=Gordonia sp. (in: high G+C Gram-positive bacteria) TaxID=84139 RepID=UPI00169ED5F7|nr:molybdenum cofactor biosynthesis protein MoaE [Gordonia sp. (in: high G+C Gram-positive bacteria)]NLG47139.1 molybdenum cofactor biosynthesis protein MoaE [Gordonia sp. (in: high G+C Gram-positive bacteria)]